jgi:hypothetical protein
MTFQASGNQKQAGVVTLIPDKVDFQPKLLRRDKEGHYILIKGTIHQEDLMRTGCGGTCYNPSYLGGRDWEDKVQGQCGGKKLARPQHNQ